MTNVIPFPTCTDPALRESTTLRAAVWRRNRRLDLMLAEMLAVPEPKMDTKWSDDAHEDN